MRCFTLPIQVYNGDEQSAVFQDAMNFAQSLWNISIVIKRLHRKSMSEFVCIEWKLLRTGNLKINIAVRVRSFARYANHLVRNVDAGHATVDRKTRQQPRRPS